MKKKLCILLKRRDRNLCLMFFHAYTVWIMCTGTCSVTLFSLIVCNMCVSVCSSFILLYYYNIFSLTLYYCYYFLFECKEHRFILTLYLNIFTTTTTETHTRTSPKINFCERDGVFECVCPLCLYLCHVFTVSASYGVILQQVVDCFDCHFNWQLSKNHHFWKINIKNDLYNCFTSYFIMFTKFL